MGADETRDVAGAGVYDGSIRGDGNCRFRSTHLKPNVNVYLLIDVEFDSAVRRVLKPGFRYFYLVGANRKRQE